LSCSQSPCSIIFGLLPHCCCLWWCHQHMLLHSIIRLQSLHPVHQCGLGCVRCNACVARVLKTFARKSPTCRKSPTNFIT
jgi:hypothetical protein